MGIASRFVRTIFDTLMLLTNPQERSPPVDPDLAARTELIRSAMLLPIGEASLVYSPDLQHQLEIAHDIDALWHLRPPWMAVLAKSHGGEALANNYVLALNALFEGVVSRSLMVAPTKPQ